MGIIKHCNLLYYKDFDTASNFSPKILRFRKKTRPPPLRLTDSVEKLYFSKPDAAAHPANAKIPIQQQADAPKDPKQSVFET
jgi:hypothetical protein